MPEAAKSDMPIRGSIGFSLVQQTILLALGATALDGGGLLMFVSILALAYWGGFALIMVRRFRQLTRIDRFLIRWGFLVLFMGLIFVGILGVILAHAFDR